MKRLHVWAEGRHVGVFTRRDADSPIRFAYDSTDATPISLSLPVNSGGSSQAPMAFLENLLPDDVNVRWRMADRLGIETIDTFDLLDRADVTGGLVFTSTPKLPDPPAEIHPLSDGELAERIGRIAW